MEGVGWVGGEEGEQPPPLDSLPIHWQYYCVAGLQMKISVTLWKMDFLCLLFPKGLSLPNPTGPLGPRNLKRETETGPDWGLTAGTEQSAFQKEAAQVRF